MQPPKTFRSWHLSLGQELASLEKLFKYVEKEGRLQPTNFGTDAKFHALHILMGTFDNAEKELQDTEVTCLQGLASLDLLLNQLDEEMGLTAEEL
jgi:hypothetical protein